MTLTKAFALLLALILITAAQPAAAQTAPVNGACGPSNKQLLTSAPTTGLCNSGTASLPKGIGPWQWTCAGSNGGANVLCQAGVALKSCVDVNGTSHFSGTTYTLQLSQTTGVVQATAQQCPYGGSQPVIATVTQTYLCSNGTQTAQGDPVTTVSANGNPTCNPAPINGVCGPSNGASFSSTPTTGLCNAGSATAVAGTGPWTWSCVGLYNGTTANCSASLQVTGCPFAATAAAHGLTDGCAGAPAGAPQLPNLLTSYGSKRPGWDVAGVEYHAGVPDELALKDPSTAALPSGCHYSSNTVSCSGSNITLNGYDFSLHSGIKVSISGSNNTVSNNNFALASKCSDPVLNFTVSANSTIIVAYNSFDGGGASCVGNKNLTFDTILNSSLANGSTATIAYNYFLNTPSDLFDSRGPSSGAAKVIMEYNLFNGQGWEGHPDGIQLNGGNFNGIVVAFNTYNNPYGVAAGGGTQPFHIEAQLTSAIANSTVAYNTMTTPGTCNGGTNYPKGCSINIDIACKSDGSGNSNTGFAAYGNYIDWSGGITALDSESACKNTSWGNPVPNMDLKTGLALPSP